MAVSRITDGLPITYEWLNSIVEEINALSAKSVGSSGSSVSTVDNIDVMGSFFNATTRTIQIIADQWSGTATAGRATFEDTISFSPAFADNNVIVVATPAFVSNGTRKGRPFKSSASVGGIDKNKFELTVSLVEDDMDFNKGKQVVINYIAIGKKA